MKHFEILKVGVSPEKRFLQKRMTGSHWTNQFHAHKFLTLGEAKQEASSHENVVIIWVDESIRNGANWGEVNPDCSPDFARQRIVSTQ